VAEAAVDRVAKRLRAGQGYPAEAWDGLPDDVKKVWRVWALELIAEMDSQR